MLSALRQPQRSSTARSPPLPPLGYPAVRDDLIPARQRDPHAPLPPATLQQPVYSWKILPRDAPSHRTLPRDVFSTHPPFPLRALRRFLTALLVCSSYFGSYTRRFYHYLQYGLLVPYKGTGPSRKLTLFSTSTSARQHNTYTMPREGFARGTNETSLSSSTAIPHTRQKSHLRGAQLNTRQGNENLSEV